MEVNYLIALQEKSDSALCFAAEELRSFILKCTGVSLEIASVSSRGFHIGGKPSLKISAAGDDAFEVVFENENVYFRANSARGVIYAVYDFIERFSAYVFYRRIIPIFPNIGVCGRRRKVIRLYPIFLFVCFW